VAELVLEFDPVARAEVERRHLTLSQAHFCPGLTAGMCVQDGRFHA